MSVRNKSLEPDEMVRRYRSGESCAAIAAVAGLDESTIRYRLKRAGVELRSAGKPRGRGPLGSLDRRIIDRYRGGESTIAIGRALGVSGEAIRLRLAAAGVKRRRQWDWRTAGAKQRTKGGE
jgi:hypothetical protein